MTTGPEQALPEGVIELERRIAAPPATVFAYFTDPERYLLWQGVAAELDPRPGGVFRVTQNDSGYIARGEYLEVEPPTRVVFTWGWEARLEQRRLDRGVAGLVIELGALALELLDLLAHSEELALHLDDLADRAGLRHQRLERLLLRLQVADARIEVDQLARHVGALDVLLLDLAEVAEGAAHGTEVGGGNGLLIVGKPTRLVGYKLVASVFCEMVHGTACPMMFEAEPISGK